MATSAPPRGWARNVLWFWVGLLIFAGIGPLGFFATGLLIANLDNSLSTILGAILIALATLVPAVLLIRSGRVVMGSGLLAGYALAALLSSGECVFLSRNAGYGAIGGAILYGYSLAGGLLLALLAFLADNLRRR